MNNNNMRAEADGARKKEEKPSWVQENKMLVLFALAVLAGFIVAAVRIAASNRALDAIEPAGAAAGDAVDDYSGSTDVDELDVYELQFPLTADPAFTQVVDFLQDAGTLQHVLIASDLLCAPSNVHVHM